MMVVDLLFFYQLSGIWTKNEKGGAGLRVSKQVGFALGATWGLARDLHPSLISAQIS